MSGDCQGRRWRRETDRKGGEPHSQLRVVTALALEGESVHEVDASLLGLAQADELVERREGRQRRRRVWLQAGGVRLHVAALVRLPARASGFGQRLVRAVGARDGEELEGCLRLSTDARSGGGEGRAREPRRERMAERPVRIAIVHRRPRPRKVCEGGHGRGRHEAAAWQRLAIHGVVRTKRRLQPAGARELALAHAAEQRQRLRRLVRMRTPAFHVGGEGLQLAGDDVVSLKPPSRRHQLQSTLLAEWAR